MWSLQDVGTNGAIGMEVKVVDVGDGACSVYTGENSLMVTDCGEGSSGKAVSSAGKLDRIVGRDSDRIQTIVVTHFDADHWKGLKAYPGVLQKKNQWRVLPTHVDFRIPRFPRAASKLPLAQLVLEAAFAKNTGTLGAALDLFGAWRSAGVQVTVHPTARADTFVGAGADWTCHWPPRDITLLPARTQTAIRKLNDDLDELASQVPEFEEALQIANGIGWVNDDAQSEANGFTSTLTGRQLLFAINTVQPTVNVGGIIRKLSTYNNAFSLVHDSVDEMGNGLLVNFGDCEKVGLNSLLGLQYPTQLLRLATQYEYLIAPHHGTQEPRHAWKTHFPRVGRSVVAQNGRNHHHNQKIAFLQSLSPTPSQVSTILDTYGSAAPITFSI